MGKKAHWDGRHITEQSLEEVAHAIAKDHGYRNALFSQSLFMVIVTHYLGDDWVLKYAHLTADKGSYLLPRFTRDNHAAIYSMRILNLAELLYNLQRVEGFDTCLEQLASGKIESGLSELQVGMLIYQSQLDFRYIDPKKSAKKSSDVEITFSPDLIARAEIKCKKESTDLSSGTVKGSLMAAREQLPAGGNGIVFIKVPQTWAAADGSKILLRREIVDATNAFLRGTTRVSEVVFYVFHISDVGHGMRNIHAVTELKNPRKLPPWGDRLFPSDLPLRWVHLPDLIDRWAAHGRRF